MTRRKLRGFAPEALTAERERRGWIRGDLARAAGVSRTSLTLWEDGTRTPTVDALWAVAQQLEVPMDRLVRIPKAKRTLVDLRVLRGMTQLQMAKLVGAQTTSLSALERGETQLSDLWVGRLVVALQVPEAEVRAAYARARNRPPGTAP